MVVKLNYLLQMAFTQCSAQLMVREMKHRAPALTSYAVAMAKTEVHQIRKETSSMVLTPGTTARAKTTQILHQGYPVPTDLCLHEAEHARKIGNKHGRFLECTACGLVKKALETDYGVPKNQGAHPDLHTTTRNSKSSRRESGSSHAKHTGLFSKLGHVLFTLIAVQFGASLQDFGKEDFGNNIYEEHGRNVESSTLFPRLSDLGRSGHGRYDGGRINEEPMQDDSLFGDGPNILKSCVRKRLKHSARRALQNSEAAREIVAERAASSRWPRRPFTYDIVDGEHTCSPPLEFDGLAADRHSSWCGPTPTRRTTLVAAQDGQVAAKTGPGGIPMHTMVNFATECQLPR
jgi:hypothetical protein